jgi:hypothetical protein
LKERLERREDEVEKYVSSYCMTLKKENILEIESTRSHPVENSLWRRL